MAAKPKNKSVGDKVKKILVDTAKGTAKDILTLGTIAGPGKVTKAATTAGTTAFKVAEKIANTKPAVAATKAVAKQVAKKDIKNTKKAVNAVANMQAKTKAEKIAKNSVKVLKSNSSTNVIKSTPPSKKIQEKVGYDIGGREGGASNLTNAIQKRSVRVIPGKKTGK